MPPYPAPWYCEDCQQERNYYRTTIGVVLCTHCGWSLMLKDTRTSREIVEKELKDALERLKRTNDELNQEWAKNWALRNNPNHEAEQRITRLEEVIDQIATLLRDR